MFNRVSIISSFFFTFHLHPLSYEARKRKKHGQIRVKLLFIPCDDKLIFWYNEPLSSFLELLSIKSYNIATANLCKDHGLTTKN